MSKHRVWQNDGATVLKNWATKSDHYGWPSIGMHWFTVIMVCGLFGLGLYMVDLTYYDPLYRVLPEWHKLLGVLLALVTVFRVLWRFLAGAPGAVPGSRLSQLTAKSVHMVLYLTLFALPLSGYLISTADGASLSPFDLFALPALVSLSSEQAELVGEAHELLAYFLVTLASLHGGAALFHHFVLKDDVLYRMTNPARFSNDQTKPSGEHP